MKDLKEGRICEPESAKQQTHHRGSSVIDLNNSAANVEGTIQLALFLYKKRCCQVKALTPDMTAHGIRIWHDKNIGGQSTKNVPAAAR
jgi:hypothetical protein